MNSIVFGCLLTLPLFAVAACDSGDGSDGDANPTSSGAAEADSDSSGGTTGPVPVTTTGSDAEGGLDTGPSTSECNLYSQDCDEGEKCMPAAQEGSPTWNSTMCTGVAANPKQLGSECTVEGDKGSGIDDCDKGLMCFGTNDENVGTCVELCGGTPTEPTCSDAATECRVTNDGFTPLCQGVCDPVLQPCADGFGCYPSGGSLACLPDRSEGGGRVGDACMFSNACEAGNMCVPAAFVPDCTSAGCCTSFCDVNDDTCPGDTQCIELFAEGEVPGFEHVGVCQLPQM